MPGPFIHISAMKHTAALLASRPYTPERAPGENPRIDPSWEGADTIALGKLMLDSPNFASLGAIGPDLFFFLPDFRNSHGISTSSVLVAILKFLEDLYAAVDPYVTKYEKYLGPIGEDQAEEMSRLTGGLSETVGDITSELSGILITFLERLVTSEIDFFGFFSLGLDAGYDEQAYFWSDMLHYRDTGQFGRAIWQRADAANDDQLRAYALGYNTHIATDVTGHAFVNAIAGGPYRMHWQRHHLVENHMDCSWYLTDPAGPANGDQYPQLTESALYYDIAFADDANGVVDRPVYPTGDTMRDNWRRSRSLDIDSKIPQSLAQLLIDAMSDVWYQTPDTSGGGHPKILSSDGRPSATNVAEAYDLFFRYLKYVTVDGFKHEPPDIPDLFPNLAFPTISEPGDSAPGDHSDDGNFWDDLLDFCLAIVRVLAYLVEVAEYLATLPWAVLADVTTYPIRLGLYYALEVPLFNILKSFRMALVMTGYMLPMDDEIAPYFARIGASTAGGFADLLASIGDVFGGLLSTTPEANKSYRDPNYPHAIVFDGSDPVEYRAPWNYPGSPTELHVREFKHEPAPRDPNQILTTVGPYARFSSPAILFGGVHQDPALRDRFENAETPGDTDVIGMAVTPWAHLGDCVAFSQYLIWLESRTPVQPDGRTVPLVEWNLDSDMGYAYHSWDWNRTTASATDPEGNSVLDPCTFPEQLDRDVFSAPDPWIWPPGTPLLIHWVGPGLTDPGCGGGPIIH